MKRRVGRPRVDGEAVNTRFTKEKLKELDEWRKQQPDLPTRPEAIRRLVDLGLSNSAK